MAELASACCSIQFSDQPMCCDMSADGPLLAVGLITGQVHLHSLSYTPGQQGEPASASAQQQWSRAVHATESSCRAVRWLPGGREVVSGAADMRIVASSVESGSQVWQIEDAHSAGVSMLRVLPGSFTYPALVASGDEDGALKLWDLRTRNQIMSFTKHSDFISDAQLHERDTCLVATSGDGTLSVHDLRTMKFRARSEADADDELLSVAVVKGGKKVVAGCGSGVLAIYSWGYFNDCSDRFPGHPESVDALVVWDDSTLLTGSSDGLVRAVSVQPNKLLGVIGAHEDMPVENLALSHDRRLLASTSHDNTVRLWDLAILQDDDEEEEEEEGEGVHEEEADLEGQGVDQGEGEEADEAEEGEEGGSGTSEGEEEEEEGVGFGVRARPAGKRRLSPEAGEDGEEEEEDSSSSGGEEEGEDEAGEGEEEEEGEESGSSSSGEDEDMAPGAGEAATSQAGRGGSGGARVQAPARPRKQPKLPVATEPGLSTSAPAATGPPTKGAGAAAGAQVRKGTATDSVKGKAGAKAPRAVAKPAAAADSDGDDDGSDGSGDEGGRAGRRKRERTRWTKDKNKQKPASNFFAGLL